MGDPGIDGRIILRWNLRKWDWIKLTQDRDRRRAIVDAVMNLQSGFHKMWGIC